MCLLKWNLELLCVQSWCFSSYHSIDSEILKMTWVKNVHTVIVNNSEKLKTPGDPCCGDPTISDIYLQEPIQIVTTDIGEKAPFCRWLEGRKTFEIIQGTWVFLKPALRRSWLSRQSICCWGIIRVLLSVGKGSIQIQPALDILSHIREEKISWSS